MKHGKRYTKEYEAWQHMKTRCLNPRCHAYKNYGGRGINICERWMDFEKFFIDMGYAPSSKHTLERIDNEKGYYTENCKWATVAEQSLNKRTTLHFPDTMIVSRNIVYHRLRRGWDLDKALHTPKMDKNKNLVSYKGKL